MDPEMVWIDLETTGLDAASEVPLELGLVITDRFGNIMAEQDWLIHDETSHFKTVMGKAIPLVKDMHTKSDLWKDLGNRESFDGGSRTYVDQIACDWLDDHNVPVGKIPMSGSSIGSLDRPFCLIHLPKLDKHFHYRNIDISSIREICKLLNPRIYEHEPQSDSKDAHRVLADCRNSIELYKFYYTEFMVWAD